MAIASQTSSDGFHWLDPILAVTVDLEFLKEFHFMPNEVRRDMWALRYGDQIVRVPDVGTKDFFVSMLKHSGIVNHQYTYFSMDTYFKLKKELE